MRNVELGMESGIFMETFEKKCFSELKRSVPEDICVYLENADPKVVFV